MGNRICIVLLLMTTLLNLVPWVIAIHDSTLVKATVSNVLSSSNPLDGKYAKKGDFLPSSKSILPRFLVKSNDTWQLWYYFFDADNDGVNDTLRAWYLVDGVNDSVNILKHELQVLYRSNSTNDGWTPLNVPIIANNRLFQGQLLGWMRIHFPDTGDYQINLTISLPTDGSNSPSIFLNTTFLDGFNGNTWTSTYGIRDGDLDGLVDTISLSYVPEWVFPDNAALHFEMNVNVWFWDENWQQWNLLERLYQNVSFDDGRFFILPREIIYNVPKNGTYAFEVTGHGNESFLFKDVSFWLNLTRFQGQWDEIYHFIDINDDNLPEELDYTLKLAMFKNRTLSLVVYVTTYWMDPRRLDWRFYDTFSEIWLVFNGTGQWRYQWPIPTRDRFRVDIRVGFLNEGLIFSRMLWINAEDGNNIFSLPSNNDENAQDKSVGNNSTFEQIELTKNWTNTIEAIIINLLAFLGVTFPSLDESSIPWIGVLATIMTLNGLKRARRLTSKRGAVTKHDN